MSLPPLNPDKTVSGIIVDPRTLERVVPATKRSDGTERKERKIRPGFTPQEDVSRFRSSRAQIYDASKGIIPGAAPTVSSPASSPMTKAQKKNEKRKEKRLAGLADEGIAEGRNWDSDDDDEDVGARARDVREETPGPEEGLGAGVSVAGEREETVPVLAPVVGSGSASVAATAESAQTTKPSDGAWRKVSSTPAPTPASPSTTTTTTTTSSPKAKSARAHTPRAGKGKSGPPGLAHESTATPAPTKPVVESPRVRKEVRVRPGGVGMGLLSERVRKLVIETQDSPRRREGSPGTPT